MKFAYYCSQNSLRFPAAHMCISNKCQYTCFCQSAGRHNTLDFANAKSCAKWGAPPLETPRNCPSLAHQFVQSCRFYKLAPHFRQYKSCKISATNVRIFYSFCEKRTAAKDDRCREKQKQIRFTNSRLLN